MEKGVRVWRRAGGGEKGCGKVCWSVGKVKGDVGKVRVVGGGGMCGEVLREVWKSVLGCGKVLGKVRKSLGGWGQGSWVREVGVGGTGVGGVEVEGWRQGS